MDLCDLIKGETMLENVAVLLLGMEKKDVVKPKTGGYSAEKVEEMLRFWMNKEYPRGKKEELVRVLKSAFIQRKQPTQDAIKYLSDKSGVEQFLF